MEDPKENWRAVVDRYWEGLLSIEPILATEVGDERFDDRLPDPSDEGRAERERIHREALDAVGSIDRADLDMVARTTLDLMEAIARRELTSIDHRMDRFQMVSHLWGPGTLLADLASLQRADSPERRERYLTRLSRVPDYLEASAGVAEEAARVGQTVPTVVIDRTIAQIGRLVLLSPEDSPALTPLAHAEPAEREPFVELVRDRLWPAYARYLDVLRRYQESARESIGLSDLPNGEAMYASEILAWTTLPLSPQEVHELGTEDLGRIQEERREIARELGHPDARSAIEDYQASGRNTASSREELVRLAEEQVQRGWDAAPRFFARMPKANCDVRPVEEYREADMPFAFYQGPTEDGTRRGVYYVNASDLEERALHHLATTTYHEANPGHHFQVSIEQEIEGRPALRRFGGILAGSAFIEGWALYCERLADEMGLFLNPYERLGMLDAQAFRAARLIVDTGIHALGWDRERAILQMMETGSSRLESTIEVDRYISLPGQALSYKVGQLQIEGWRAEAQRREGFSLPAFHDRLLSLGSLPLEAIKRELDSDGDGSGRAEV
jgi:uncharacterized protein (DUF885 family)